MPTGINWTDETWNPIVGCSKISPGCANCYAAESAKSARLQQFPQYQKAKEWNGAIAFVESQLIKPFRWRKPRKIFVCSMSDLFHENVTDEMRDKVFAVMALCSRHTFQVLTKRPENALKYFSQGISTLSDRWADIAAKHFEGINFKFDYDYEDRRMPDQIWLEVDSATDSGYTPLKNVWMGVTVENQAMAEKRIPLLLKIPVAKRWLSMEPLLEAVDLTCDETMTRYIESGHYTHQLYEKYGAWEDFHFLKALDWVVVGGESGKNARPCHLDWITSVVQQCQQNNVPVFVKQLGANVNESGNRIPNPKGDRAWSKLENLPKYLQIRQFPYA